MAARALRMSWVCLLLAGCAVGPDYKRPEMVTPATWRDAKPVVEDSLANVPWWELFKDEQLRTLITVALTQNRDLKIAVERIEEARANVGIAKADFYPSVSILGSTGFSTTNADRAGGPGLGDLFKSDSFFGFLGLQVNLPFLNYDRITNNVRVQDARYEQAAASYQETVLRAAAEVESGLSSFLHSREQATYYAESVAAAERAVELSLIQYRNGAVDFIRVNDAQTVLVTSQETLVSARANVAFGAIETYRALGGGWEIRGDGEFVDKATLDRMRARTDWGDVLSQPQQPESEHQQ